MNIQKRGFTFKTFNNNYYFYDDNTGYVEDATEKKEKIYYGITGAKPKTINICEVESVIKKTVTKQLILNITEDCNMRCKYCVYSGNYKDNRTHSKQYMSEIVAKKAVEQYIINYKKQKRYDITNRPIISFFGGEPLLNFKLIKYVIQLVADLQVTNAIYTITTNGLLFSDKIIHFLVENNFDLTISLNGNKEENDRLRILENGLGTYDIIESNLKKINTLYPDYYKNKVFFSVVYDIGTDLLKLEKFFAYNELVKNKLSSYSEVMSAFTNWYDQYSSDQKILFKNGRNQLKDIFFQNVMNNNNINSVLKKMFAEIYILILNRNMGDIRKGEGILPYTGACIPGTKISVGCEGNLYLCEKVNSSTPIGDIENWLNYSYITKLLNEYNKVSEKCINCPIQRLCPLCYRILINGSGSLELNQLDNCENLINQFITGFSDIYFFLESGIDVYKVFMEG